MVMETGKMLETGTVIIMVIIMEFKMEMKMVITTAISTETRMDLI